MVLEAGSNSAAEAVACVSFYETGFRFRVRFDVLRSYRAQDDL